MRPHFTVDTVYDPDFGCIAVLYDQDGNVLSYGVDPAVSEGGS